MDDVDVIVIGAGVVGLATARALALSGLQCIVVDAEDRFGMGTSSRNSEVIHAGIYYPAGSLKASLCVRGRALLYRYCAAHDVPHRRIEKLIFATDADGARHLDAIEAAARDADVHDLRRLDAQEVRALEPHMNCHQAILSPSTGIVDSHALMVQYLADIENAGGMLAVRTRATGLTRANGLWHLHVAGEDGPVLAARRVVNGGGLHAHQLAAHTEGLSANCVPQVRFAKGNYFTYAGRIPFSRLIYPTPEPGGLGTHLTFDLGGSARFGPDVEWIDGPEAMRRDSRAAIWPPYVVDPARGARFVAAARKIWPDLDPERMAPAYSGIRPKLSGPGDPAADFRIDGPELHGLPGLVNLFGIESPGLTSSLAIAELVTERLGVAEVELVSGEGW